MWSAINYVLGRNRSGRKSNQFLIDEEIVTDDRLIVESFNEYFSNIGGRLANYIPSINKYQFMTIFFAY